MARLADLHPDDRANLAGKRPPSTGSTRVRPRPGPLPRSRIALVTTAGLHLRGDRGFDMASAEYRAHRPARPRPATWS